jgi:hypothetical protein
MYRLVRVQEMVECEWLVYRYSYYNNNCHSQCHRSSLAIVSSLIVSSSSRCMRSRSRIEIRDQERACGGKRHGVAAVTGNVHPGSSANTSTAYRSASASNSRVTYLEARRNRSRPRSSALSSDLAKPSCT